MSATRRVQYTVTREDLPPIFDPFLGQAVIETVEVAMIKNVGTGKFRAVSRIIAETPV